MDNGASSYRRFLDGDDEGLAEIISTYNDGLTFYLNSLVKDLSAADELSADVFVKIGVKKPFFSGRSSFKTWLYAIGRNLALDHLRKKAKSSTLPLDENAGAAGDAEAEKEFLKEESKIVLYEAMRALSDGYRQVLWLVYFEDMSAKEAAAVVKKPVHAVENLLSRARQALRTELQRKGYTYEDL